MKRTFVLLLVAFLLVACGAFREKHVPHYGPAPGTCDRVFVVSPDFDTDEVAALNRAVERWNYIATEQFCLSSGTGNERTVDHGIFKTWRGTDEYNGWAKDEPVIGLHWSGSDEIAIVGDLPIEDFELVALHELGHAHGLGHTPPPSIMCAYIGTADDFTGIDLDACRAAGACPPLLDAGSSSEIASQAPENACTLLQR